ncbi:MAG: flagellin-like protein, partial [Magnetovibrio sp.]|nr:flagellin-like protein [Magnetovibrio sp.]
SAASAGTNMSAASAGSGLSAGMAKLSAYISAAGTDFSALGYGFLVIDATSKTLVDTDAIRSVGIGYTEELNGRVIALNSDLSTLRSNAQVLGSNIATLKTRLTFTKDYVTTLTAGAGKLTLADLNEEGANLLALQTRQQLGIQSLAFAGQSEQSILGLFR